MGSASAALLVERSCQDSTAAQSNAQGEPAVGLDGARARVFWLMTLAATMLTAGLGGVATLLRAGAGA